jgi:hypothetical protein
VEIEMRILLVSCLGLAACGGNSAAPVVPVPQPNGTLETTSTGGIVRLTEGGGYRYDLTILEKTIEAKADVLPGLSITNPPATGSASMVGNFNLRVIPDIGAPAPQDITGDITLTADFDAQTLTGSGDGLGVQGTFGGTDLGGTVSYATITGDLSGSVAADKAIGVFEGQGGKIIYAGGFFVLAP